MWLLKCDGCGKEVTPQVVQGKHLKPKSWFQHNDQVDILDACSMECANKIDEKRKKQNESPSQPA